ncbi:succinyl-diaminopimelate desuccinylase [Pseudoalteromonas sp. MMG007]|uniref:succinyl-diaminopimelate desuccinylase n=1 Tax=Pseudoalteromonas sp. MMG007 TaxID=2822684 RepID=UPI001B382095|nr:succinyl-diaminopimelate desuccinylase [Pseudoalteromonas sp. MMG007]MBQ4859999.1 succinyl-diaminopimelate desuccinylase [Pseudoalteromonas sp. MMG007]
MQGISAESDTSLDVKYLIELINFPSVTPFSAGCMEWLSKQLQNLGFVCRSFNKCGVTNMIAELDFGKVGPTFAFAGHIDVVPADTNEWHSDPFEAQIIGECIVGRGAADMKGAIAAMLAACEILISSKTPLTGKLLWLITSDEEGEAEFGTYEIVQKLKERNLNIDYCLVGEPTCDSKIGDTIKNGRRGAISGKIIFEGRKGHVAYPQKSINAAHVGIECAKKLVDIDWRFEGKEAETSLQVTNLHVPYALDNIVPGQCHVDFNIRYGHELNSEIVKSRVHEALEFCQKKYFVNWERACEPYYSNFKEEGASNLLDILERSININVGIYPKLSTSGGTSDGRFIREICEQVIEFGLRNYCIHQINEKVAISELNMLTKIYSDILRSLFVSAK